MLPLPNLDDRLFDEIVAEARKMIPKLSPQWTDENPHDPGITMLELFSHLSEMQQYYLNRVTVKNELKFLRMMGIHLRQAESAKVDVSFAEAAKPQWMPVGTKLRGLNEPFETTERLLLVPAQIDRVLVAAQAEMSDHSSANEHGKVGYFAFGSGAKQGSRLYLAFDSRLPVGLPITLTFDLVNNYQVPINPTADGEDEQIPPAKISWSYSGIDESVESRPLRLLPLPVERDDTLHLSRSGRITFTVPKAMAGMRIHPANDKDRYWICATLEEPGYELPPKVDKILLNTVQTVHRDTRCQILSFDGTGEMYQEEVVHGYLPFYGDVEVQVETETPGLWRIWQQVEDLTRYGPDDACCVLYRDEQKDCCYLRFGNGEHGMIPTAGPGTIRVIAAEQNFREEMLIGRSNGLPGQHFQVAGSPILPQSLRLQVAVQEASGEWLWQDWTRVDDFEHSGPDDRHYVLDPGSGEIYFGNSETGQIPDVAEHDNIRLIALQVGGGERGNVQRRLITQFARPEAFGTITVINHDFAKGGAERETLEEAKARMRRELKQPTRAVTCEDFENIALATPGLRVARAKAVPLYQVGLKGYPQEQAPAQVTVVVVPYSEDPKPLPSKGFLSTVQSHLDQHRLLTTEVHVVPPEYVKITVQAVVVVTPDTKDIAARINTALHKHLDVLDNSDPNNGWDFGRAVYKGDIYGIINQMTGVEYIQTLWFEAEGAGVQKDPSGDILLPPHGLVYSGNHQIELVSRTDV
ncbi:putative phage baseplate assembly protein [Tumebacillus sp. BK434]|uniref:putative baseplate assembly protein n=1 Tax=Tumebacillus sp. BK434 TaxID=2512169 RepID=UPI0010429F20|nr:putative baseplate assembly protein [Tumebacillus sp. BK434]TCP59008.1 putative phage baseplate assembly protein [Tumebacillus sp. BK434]